jgi:hypothetical protein
MSGMFRRNQPPGRFQSIENKMFSAYGRAVEIGQVLLCYEDYVDGDFLFVF